MPLDARLFQDLIEPFISALRHQDEVALKKLVQKSASLATTARAQVSSGADTVSSSDKSYALGAIETIEAFCAKASQQPGGSAQLEALHLPGARNLLIKLGRHKTGTTLTQIVDPVAGGANAGSTLRFVLELKHVGLMEIEEPGAGDSRVRITESGIGLLNQLDPGWRDTLNE